MLAALERGESVPQSETASIPQFATTQLSVLRASEQTLGVGGGRIHPSILAETVRPQTVGPE